MSQTSLTQRQQEQIRRLDQLSTELAAGLAENRQRLQDHLTSADRQCAELTAHLDRQSAETIGDLEGEYNKRLEAARVQYDADVGAFEQKRATKSDQLSVQRAKAIAAAIEDFEITDLRLRDRRVHDAKQLKQRHEQFVAKCRDYRQQLDQLHQESADHLQRRGVGIPSHQVKAAAKDDKTWSSTLIQAFDGHVERLSEHRSTLRQSRVSRFLDEGWSILLFLGVVLASAWPLGQVTNHALPIWLAAVLTIGILVTLFTYLLVHRVAAKLFQQTAPEIAKELAESNQLLHESMRASERETKVGLAELQRQCTDEANGSTRDRQQSIEQAEAEFHQQSTELEQVFVQQLAKMEQAWERETDLIRTRYRPQLDERRKFFEKQRGQTLQNAALNRDRAEQQFERERQDLQERWQEAITQFSRFAADVRHQCAPIIAKSSEIEQWAPPTAPPDAIPLGRYQLTLPAKPGDDDNHVAAVQVPALLSFPHDASMMLKADGDGRKKAVEILQNTTLRMLSSFPPGKLRLTIIDPLGLGQNFSAFMHLADYDERLVSSRIWTETAHIDQRLTDLTEHMENVIQKYLRNEFVSIQQYNQHAGEVAEPFRILVIADYPHQFSDESSRRLASIAASGPRCGVYTLMSVDMTTKLPKDAKWDELQRNAQVFHWQTKGFANEREPMARLPLTFDDVPDNQTITQIVKAVGEKAENTRRVQVPFSTIAPPADELWSADCAEELIVPLGRSGATQSLSLRLGRGTSQHVLIAGKTGSGKSTLLHALITDAALKYSPDEVQFYLIDFKKGVEFKAYADYQLPHARVVAIESEREFGLSVLHRLDQELRRRGDVFRNAGVQTLAACRAKQPDQPMPRLLLIVDEFQEFFVNDDKLAHEASLLLDRLVRQGRAFGIHIILGSQTLAGAYSLARSTIGQMAVRIALECSAADAHLILSEDNTAARLLGRPGEAIYNDANGRLEGNHPFQVVWLSDEQRNEHLGTIRQLSIDQRRDDAPPIVFEGHAAAELATNAELQQLLDAGSSLDSPQPPRAWLGAAIEIKEPTSVDFRRQGGANLLMVGQSRELARGLLGSSLVSLIATHGRAPSSQPSRVAQFWVLDGERAEHPQTAFADRLQPFFSVSLNTVGPATAAATVQRIATMLEERLGAPETTRESVYLVIHDLARFRELQPAADDFGLGGFGGGDATTPAAQFAKILRDGPPVGIHTLVWADCFHTVSRWLERQTLRDLGQRVLLQMSAVDSSHLMDSAIASQLGAHRALLYDQDRGQTEKFRPYGLPSTDWLSEFQKRLEQPPIESFNPDQGSAPSDAESLVEQDSHYPVRPPNSGVDR